MDRHATSGVVSSEATDEGPEPKYPEPADGNRSERSSATAVSVQVSLDDALTEALSARDNDIHMLAHPLVVVRRAPLGALVEIRGGVEPEEADQGDVVES